MGKPSGWVTTALENILGSGYVCEIEYYEGNYWWTVKTDGKVIADGKSMVLANAKRDAIKAAEARS